MTSPVDIYTGHTLYHSTDDGPWIQMFAKLIV